MGSYVPNTPQDQESMLKTCGFDSFDDMYRDIPQSVRLNSPLNLPPARSELEVRRIMNGLAEKTGCFTLCFAGQVHTVTIFPPS